MWLDLSRNILGIQNNLKIRGSTSGVVPAYTCRVVLRIKYNPFGKFLRLGDLAWNFLGLTFGPGIILGYVGNPRDVFVVLIFVPIRSSPSLEIRSISLRGQTDNL